MSLHLSYSLLLRSAGSLFPSFHCCHVLYCFPLHEHLSWSCSRPPPLIANGRLSPDRSLTMLHRSPRRKWLLSGWQSTFYLSPGARVHQCFPELGRSLLEGIFCTTFPHMEGWCASAESQGSRDIAAICCDVLL